MAAHFTHFERSDVLIGSIKNRRENVRFWFSANNTLVGIWQGRNGKTYAVGHNREGRVIIYRASTPQDNWKLGSADCLNGYAR